MSKSKKSSKSAKIPQPIKVKKEKVEEDRALHSMAHYVDDRIELVKQVFGSLKNKTITNLAPEYLKENDMDEIQELCLNELLCLSKKRLLSIINATKCPTDTESSEDSDVEAKEEHISLEEISSGSELENGEKSTKKTASQSRTKRNPPKIANQAENKNNGDGGQMSVLELLELQARARAIRSQLALEPVTKIEVDLDDDENDRNKNENVSSTTKDQKSNRKRKKLNNKEIEKTTTMAKASSEQQSSPSMELVETEKSSNMICSQKIKLKRNFRRQNQDTPEADSSEQQQDISICQKIKNEEKDKDKDKEKDKVHSPSPDVIPIEPVPETFCISDSGSDTEQIPNKEINKRIEEHPPIPDRDEETEDGEIVDDYDTETIEPCNDISQKFDTMEKPYKKSINADGDNNIIIIQNEILHSSATPYNSSIKNGKDIFITTQKDENVIESGKIPATSHGDCIQIAQNVHDIDGDQNDDVISIEGGDLETEMSEHLDEDTLSKCTAKRNFNQEISADENNRQGNDVISLESSENEDEFGESDNIDSWHDRYLKSSKVSKVLAVSRLGKRVRDKLKTSKHTKKQIPDDHHTKEDETKNFTSKHEDGSVEQYKELLELTHRKV